MKKICVWLTLVCALMTINGPARAELIVLASPPGGEDDYYAQFEEAIADFHIDFAETILAHGDDVLILSSTDFYDF
jgi:hypothetical protein